MTIMTLATAASLTRWVGWRNLPRKGKIAKVPFAPRTGRMAKANDPTGWVRRAEAEAWARDNVDGIGGGIGLQLGQVEGEDYSLGGVDLDRCRDPATGAIEPWAQAIVVRLGSYTEVSPSGTGVKVFFRYSTTEVAALRRAMGTEHGRRFTCGRGEHPPGVELHISNRYFAVTDQHLEDAPAELRHVGLPTLVWLATEAGPAFEGGGETQAKPAQWPLIDRRGSEAPASAGSGEAPDTEAPLSRLHAARRTSRTLDARWQGSTAGLRDTSRSGMDMSMMVLLKLARFSYREAKALLLRWQHGAGAEHGSDDRYFRRMWERSAAGSAAEPAVECGEVAPTLVAPGQATVGEPESPLPTGSATVGAAPAPDHDAEANQNPGRVRGRREDINGGAGKTCGGGGGSAHPTQRGVPTASPETSEEPWPEPVDFLADEGLTGVPELRPDHLPDALYPFVADTAARMGVDPVSVTLSALVACASVIDDAWQIQPKVHDHTWTENPRIWGAIVGDPSILKTPVIRACTRPIDALDAQARHQHAAVMHTYRVEHAVWKKEGCDPTTEPRLPRLDRYLVEGTTIEALTEVLRDDAEAKQRAPTGKVLVRQDEMAEFFANLDRYRSGGKGGGDRGAYLRLYNGGRYVLERVGRGAFDIPNWSACFLGGIQPGPIQRVAREADDDGLLQRFIYCVPGRQAVGEDRVPDAAALLRYEALLPALAKLHPPKAGRGQAAKAVVLDTGAHSCREATDRLSRALAAMPDTSPRVKAALGKWPGLFARLSLIFHLVNAADTKRRNVKAASLLMVPEGVAGRVAALMRDVLLPHLLRADAVMFSTAQTGHARWVAGFILAHERLRITQRDVVQAYGALRAPEAKQELRDVMESLVTVGWLRPEVQANPARPTSAWEVNPAVHTVFAERARREREARRQAQLAMRETITLQRQQAS